MASRPIRLTRSEAIARGAGDYAYYSFGNISDTRFRVETDGKTYWLDQKTPGKWTPRHASSFPDSQDNAFERVGYSSARKLLLLEAKQ